MSTSQTNGHRRHASRALALVVMRPAELVPVNDRTLAVLAPRFLVWLGTVRGRAENTVLAYGRDLQSFVRACAQANITEADQVTWREVEAYLGWLREVRGLKVSTVIRHRAALRALWVFLVREGIAETSPVAVAFSQKTPPADNVIPLLRRRR